MFESMEKRLNAIVMRAVGRISSYKIGDLLMKVFLGNNHKRLYTSPLAAERCLLQFSNGIE